MVDILDLFLGEGHTQSYYQATVQIVPDFPNKQAGALSLETGRMLGDDVEGAFEGEAGAAEGAFFEEAAD